jgi:hypothetical protein
MKLQERHTDKIDPLLRDALKQAQGDEMLRAVMVLGPERTDAEEGLTGEALDPAQFPSREAYRQTLITQRQNQLAHDLRETLQALQGLSLTPRGGTMSRTVVVEGPACQILASLDLPGVRHASLDRPIELIRPRRRG